jgi:hypothetical protein
MIKRKILRAACEVWRGELADMGAPDKRIQECQDLFESIDGHLSGITATSTNNALLMETMTSADFTNAIQTFVTRLLIPGYQKKNFNFESLVWNDVLINFLNHNRYQNRGSLDDLEYVGEKGQARPGSVDDATARIYRVYRWEKQYDFSWEAIRNDDLGYFSDQATLMGESARRSIEKFVSRMYTNATTIARLIALGALFSQNGRLTSARISEARMGFNQRVDSRNEPINARLAFIVGHSGLADTALQIQSSQLVPELATNAANIVQRNWQWIEDPYIAGTAPNLPWYGFTNWRENNVRPFVLARMQNFPGPLIIRKKSDQEAVTSMLGSGAAVDPMMGDFDTGNIILKVVDVWGTYIDGTEGNLFDSRGAYYSTGTAP